MRPWLFCMVVVVLVVVLAFPGRALGGPGGSFLRALGLHDRPPRPHGRSPNANAEVPPLLWKIFQRKSQEKEAPEDHAGGGGGCWMEELHAPGNILRRFADQGGPAHPRAPPVCLRKRLYFNVSALEAGERVTAARLELRFGQNLYRAASTSGPFDLRLFRVTRASLAGMSAHNRRAVLSQSFLHVHKSFSFDVTPVAGDWRTPSRNLGLVLEIGARDCSGLDSFREASLFVVSLSRCRSPRKKRGAYYVPPAGAANVCKPRGLYIGFGDVGWENWIIAPQGYQANYCLGECPFPLTEELNGTNHAILQTIVHSLDPRGTPQPCCVPVRLSPISILYYDNDDNVVLRHYEDMVVDECGCR
ncbi:embryonic growth/differentiation factor 1 [Anolis carolinensis]|uniref:embryonic growth/differentiation factor 1 n=1 Tax=Anolis carolinensis TaxID=28377 RepID=UPI002F2B6D83